MKALLATAGLALALTACGITHTARPPGSSTQKDAATAQQIVQGCIGKGNALTKSGRLAILTCIAPKGHRAAFESCAQSKLAHADLFTRSGRQAYEQQLAICVEKNR